MTYALDANIIIDILNRESSVVRQFDKTGHTVGDADVIIAAHCIEHGYTLVTHNTKHFKHIKGMLLIDWPK